MCDFIYFKNRYNWPAGFNVETWRWAKEFSLKHLYDLQNWSALKHQNNVNLKLTVQVTLILTLDTGSVCRSTAWKSVVILRTQTLIFTDNYIRNRDWLYFRKGFGRNNRVHRMHYVHTVSQHQSNSIIKTAVISNKFTNQCLCHASIATQN